MTDAGRLPPGQQWVAAGKWPLVGEPPPDVIPDPWTVEVKGCVYQTRTWTLAELLGLPVVQMTLDIHCVTRWSRPATVFGGVLLETVLEHCPPSPEARYVSFLAHSTRGHSSSLPLDVALKLKTLLAWQADGQPLSVDHGGPLRVVTPQRYFYKSVKWLRAIELLTEDRLGYWEQEAGYHNEADPWREQRYMAPSLTKQQMQRLLETRCWQNQVLRSLEAVGRHLQGLNARGALLRDADFRRADLRGACFCGANLSNARFQQADLRQACLVGADLEGAHLEGADLRGADLRGASLLGATFVVPIAQAAPQGDLPGAGPALAALLDQQTLLSRSAVDALTPDQAAYVATRGQLVSD
jgi:DMSO/TMAO reductase YedYZ molybdopterin-dependent catalytic subunit